MIENDKVISYIGGERKEYNIVFDFDCKENGKTYVAYTDDSTVDGKLQITFAYYDTEYNTGELFFVEDPEEIEFLNRVLSEMKEKQQ